jgi:hypothetical protein
LRVGLGILCRKQVDYLGASGETAELDVYTGIGERKDGLIELPRQRLRVWAEREELEQFRGGTAPSGRALQEGVDGIDEGIRRGRGVEGFEHFLGGAVEGGGCALGPRESGGVAVRE